MDHQLMDPVVIELLKAALAVVGSLFMLLIGVVAFFLRRFAGTVDDMRRILSDMRVEYATVKTAVDSVEKGLNGIRENHGGRLGELEKFRAGVEHDVTAVMKRLERLEGAQR